MKAVTYTAFGAAADVLQVQDLPDVSPAPGEIIVDIAFSGVNPSDVKARAGSRPGETKPPFPVIVPHSDGSGVISAVGEGVAESRVGERVWIWNGQWQRAFGTAARQIAVPSEQAVKLPDDVSLQSGAVLGIPGLTATHAVFSGSDIAGKTVLVHGGAGTVGYLAVQLAKWGGARVIATANPRNHDRVLAAGADAALDYAATDLADRILDASRGAPVDKIVDVEFGQNAETNAAVIAENGRINAYGSAQVMSPTLPFYRLMFKAVTLETILVYILTPEARSEAVAVLTRALTQGALQCPVQTVYDLEDCALAHQAVEAGNREGAVLLGIE